MTSNRNNSFSLKICDAVAVAKILNATLVVPHFEVNPVWQDSRYVVIVLEILSCFIVTWL